MNNTLIQIKNCRIEKAHCVVIKNISWEMNDGEVWFLKGDANSKKDVFLEALFGKCAILPNGESSLCNSTLFDSVELVSLERASSIIQYEKEHDESDYTEGGVDIGRTCRKFINEVGEFLSLDENHVIKLLEIEHLLDRGIKYLSTGEMRRVLLARALLSKKKLLIFSEPFAGLDVGIKKTFRNFFEEKLKNDKSFPHVIFSMERYSDVPSFVTHVLEFKGDEIFSCCSKSDYENSIQFKKRTENIVPCNADIMIHLEKTLNERYEDSLKDFSKKTSGKNVLVKMENVNVSWGTNHVLKNLTWQLNEGEHYLIRGPNGSGKTTFLELITGDNPQVYSNDIWVFGIKRGSGETMWEIKSQMGIVSYRLHVEYRMVSSTTLQNVIISGFKDSIGLYEKPTDIEIQIANEWMKFGNFFEKANEPFSSLSYGEQRSLLILRACVKSPKILVLDEPCHALDEVWQKKVLLLLEEIAKKGTTTLLHVTHEEDEILPSEKHILQFIPNQNPNYKITIL